MKEKLIKLLFECQNECNSTFCHDCEYYGKFPCFSQWQANHLITNGVTVQKWIPVSDSPKERGCYLVTVKHWLDGKPVVREAFWNSVDWLGVVKREEITPRVTHWMPPKGE